MAGGARGNPGRYWRVGIRDAALELGIPLQEEEGGVVVRHPPQRDDLFRHACVEINQ